MSARLAPARVLASTGGATRGWRGTGSCQHGAMPTFAGDSGPRVIRAAHLALAWEPVAPAQSVAGDPRTGSAEVVERAGDRGGRVVAHPRREHRHGGRRGVRRALRAGSDRVRRRRRARRRDPATSGSCPAARRPPGPSTRSCARSTSSGPTPEVRGGRRPGPAGRSPAPAADVRTRDRGRTPPPRPRTGLAAEGDRVRLRPVRPLRRLHPQRRQLLGHPDRARCRRTATGRPPPPGR